ncbi:hypothetical protein GCM10027515_24290 [Schumannella luteola]|uniref:DUF308 domain-containing protein n=1 Tax=Schumannella luteola TaxID=472059 RepID=A0A852YB59_9MICO|nr:hypothetical protein [Schumannella luteola]NYG99773.1 hypothetical protein [Schumannella luteola]TPX06548.1 hypothetical protein FJ656_00950 [Schumannella luteola]
MTDQSVPPVPAPQPGIAPPQQFFPQPGNADPIPQAGAAQPQYGQQPQYSQAPYAQAPYDQAQYGQHQYGQTQYAQPQPGAAPYAWSAAHQGQQNASAFGAPAAGMSAARKAGLRTMLVGFGIMLVGIVITAGTFFFAAPGGSYVVTWGAIIFGGVQGVAGLVRFLRN